MTPPHRPLILLGLNEINLDYVEGYVRDAVLPNFARLLAAGAVAKTSSERVFRELEPWIQWVSIHTGKTFAEHGVFRLGDIVDRAHVQIWEHLEATYGVKVAALAPMNAANRTRAPAFFLPDFWTDTPPSGSWFLRRLSEALTDTVIENAASSARPSSYFYVFLAMLRYSLWRDPHRTVRRIAYALRDHAHRAIFLDELLVDLFVTEWRRTCPDFATVFLNAGGHIQHHYLYNSSQYRGPNRNPPWYIAASTDPLLDAYKSYDEIVRRVLALPGQPRVLIATGLRQVPVRQPICYWRLRDPAGFCRRLGLRVQSGHQRMSRDFMVSFAAPEDASAAEALLASCVGPDGIRIFGEIDNRGRSLYVTLSYPHGIGREFTVRHRDGSVEGFGRMVVFVTPKNGEHAPEGFLYDSDGQVPTDAPFPITGIFGLIESHFAGSREGRAAA